MAPGGDKCVLGEQVGAGPPALVTEKDLGPALPAVFVAVTLNVLVAAIVGVPVREPAELRDSHPGKPVELHVIGAVPVAVKEYEYGIPIVAPGSGLALVIIGGLAELAMVNEKFWGPADPFALVAVIGIVLVPLTVGVPASNPDDDRVAQDGMPTPAVHVIGGVPVATNWNEYGTPTVPSSNGLLLVIVGPGPGLANRHASALSMPGAPNASP